MNPIRAVIFDFFGTLVPNFALSEHKEVLRKMASAIGAPAEPFVERWLWTFNERATGVYPSVRANIEAVCQPLNITPGDSQYEAAVRLRYEFEKRHIAPRATALSTLRAVRALGLKTGLISDCSTEFPEIWDETPFAPSFDVAVFSCRVKIRKPNPEIYFEACRQLGVTPAECLYVGDGGSRELTGARGVGMRAVRLAVPEEQANPDTHRVDGESWDGEAISELEDLLPKLALGIS